MTTGHLVHECEQAIAAALDKVDGVEFCYLSPADKAASLVALAVLLCSHHHHRAHDDRFQHDRLPNGDLRFHRRT